MEMTEKRYKLYDVGSSYLTSCGVESPNGDCFENMTECCKELNLLAEENKQLKKQLDYIQNSISNAIKHQKTEIGQKALMEVIGDYNEWMLGHRGDDKL